MTDTLREQLQASLGSTYAVGRELGGGGMSRVFVAEDGSLGRSVVVKVLSPELMAGVNVDRFRREIRLAARLQHPHIVPVLHSGETEGLPYFTMPFVEGQSLRVRLAQGGPLPIGDVVSILRDVAKALEYAHARDVVHRDIKPDNVLLAGNAAVVTDFGIAKALSASKTAAPGATLTQAGTSLGTPAYMAPEQAAADPSTDHRADIYAFGILAYELLAGHPPFAGRSPQKLLAAQLGERPASIATVRADTPPALAELVTRCLEKSADDRPQNAATLVRFLDTVTTSGATPPAPALLLGGRTTLRNALLIYAAAFLIVALAARIATNEIGLPDWVFPGAIVVMLLGLPVILFTGYVQRTLQRALTRTPTLTPGGTPAPASTMATIAFKASPHVTWRRTALGGAVALGLLVVLIAGYMVTRALGIGPAGSLLGAGTLHARDRLIVADFRAPGGDTSLAAAASDAVRTDLSQSDVISLLAPADVAGTLRLMRRPPTTAVDVPVAQEVAAREGAKGIVDGSIASLGSGYLITLRLLTSTGTELASFHDAANTPHDLLPTLDALARQLRAKIGESLKSVHGDPPLEQVTTSSLAALRAYDEGVRANDMAGDEDRAIVALRQAVALDTGFAMAYRKLGVAMGNAQMPDASIDSALTQAYRYRDRLTDRERQMAIATYFEQGPGHDRQQAAHAYHALLAADPTDMPALNNLAIIEDERRRYTAADSLLRHAVATGRGGAVHWGNLVRTEQFEGDTAAVRRDAALMRARYPDAQNAPFIELGVYYDRNQLDSMDAILTRARKDSHPGRRFLAEDVQSRLAIVRGQPAAWDTLQAEARRIDAARGAPVIPFEDSVRGAWIDIALRGQAARGVTRLDALLARTPLRTAAVEDRPYFDIADAYAAAGRPDRARAVLATYQAEVTDTALRRDLEPEMHRALGEIALAERRPRDALREFARADTAADGYPTPCPFCYALGAGRAYDEAGNADSAVLMLERYESVPVRHGHWPSIDEFYRALVYKRLGELYEMRGDAAHAATNYRQFIALWKDADPDLQPVVADARRHLAKLGAEPAGRPM